MVLVNDDAHQLPTYFWRARPGVTFYTPPASTCFMCLGDTCYMPRGVTCYTQPGVTCFMCLGATCYTPPRYGARRGRYKLHVPGRYMLRTRRGRYKFHVPGRYVFTRPGPYWCKHACAVCVWDAVTQRNQAFSLCSYAKHNETNGYARPFTTPNSIGVQFCDAIGSSIV